MPTSDILYLFSLGLKNKKVIIGHKNKQDPRNKLKT